MQELQRQQEVRPSPPPPSQSPPSTPPHYHLPHKLHTHLIILADKSLVHSSHANVHPRYPPILTPVSRFPRVCQTACPRSPRSTTCACGRTPWVDESNGDDPSWHWPWWCVLPLEQGSGFGIGYGLQKVRIRGRMHSHMLPHACVGQFRARLPDGRECMVGIGAGGTE